MLTNARNHYAIYYKVETASTTREQNANKFIRCQLVCGNRETLEAKITELREAGKEIKYVRNGCGEIVKI